ncbi:MAG: type II secretion system protein [Cyanobacteriota bacterium]
MTNKKGFSLLELLIVIVILISLTLIAAPRLLDAAQIAKEGAIKSNVSAAASTVTTHLYVDAKEADQAASDAVDELNQANSADDDTDDARNPFYPDEDAFVAAEIPDIGGQVTLSGQEGEYKVLIKGWNQKADTVVASKTVSADE